jgi:hypothetical protein
MACILALVGCAQRLGGVARELVIEPDHVGGDWISGEIHEMSVRISSEQRAENPHQLLTLRGGGEFRIVEDGPEWAEYEQLNLVYAPADLLLYKILFIPFYAIEGTGKALSRGESQHLNGIIFVDLASRLTGRPGRRDTLTRDVLDVSEKAKLRFNYWENLYNGKDWISPFLGTGAFFPGDEADWSPLRFWGYQRNRIILPVNGRTIYLSGKIPMECIRSITIQSRSDGASAAERNILILDNPASISIRARGHPSTNSVLLDLDEQKLNGENVEILIVDFDGHVWRGNLEKDYRAWEASLLRIAGDDPVQFP